MSVFFSAPALSFQLDGYEIVSETVRTVTAYNVGDPDQTSGRPCLAASGKDLCQELAAGEKMCAANFVPLGTLLDIENVGICRVADRTAERFENRVDIAMPQGHRRQALDFGERQLTVKILKKNK
ncbi:MAG: 3D domain-containing protein [Desulfobacterales bacterium]